jgi:hypothetical protein
LKEEIKVIPGLLCILLALYKKVIRATPKTIKMRRYVISPLPKSFAGKKDFIVGSTSRIAIFTIIIARIADKMLVIYCHHLLVPTFAFSKKLLLIVQYFYG